jgi:hypothetical protein
MAYMGWTPKDRGLAEALIEHEAAIGPHGIPWDVALDPESDGWLEVEEITDYAQAALDRWHEDRSKSPAEPGVRVHVVDARTKPPDDPAGGDQDRAEDQPDGVTTTGHRPPE